MPGRLTVFFPRGAARQWRLQEGCAYVAGRDPSCEVHLPDDRVSRRHATITEQDGWTIADLGSKNGTLVDGRPAEGSRLPEDCWISLGGLPCHFTTQTVEEAAAADRDRLARWHTTVERQRRLDPSADIRLLLDELLDAAREITEADRGFVVLVAADGTLDVAVRCPTGEAPAEEVFLGSSSAVTQVLETGEALVVCDAAVDAWLGQRASVLEGGIRQLVCLPLLALGRILGALYCDARSPGRVLTDLDLDVLQALADHAALALRAALLQRELAGLAGVLEPAPPGRPLPNGGSRAGTGTDTPPVAGVGERPR